MNIGGLAPVTGYEPSGLRTITACKVVVGYAASRIIQYTKYLGCWMP